MDDTSQARLAAKIAGKNYVVKFLDGEEIYVTLEPREGDDGLALAERFLTARFYAGPDHFYDPAYFPCADTCVNPEAVKYIIPL